MATILLSAAGAALGGLSSGTFLGLTGAVIGRAVGATVGRVIDQRLLGSGSEVIEQGRLDRFRLSGASEGASVARLYGQMRLGGQVIWATRFKEHVTISGGGGKGAPPTPRTASYSYSVSLAVALCEGEISRVGRVWADGSELGRTDLTMRVYRGTDDQMPDPKMEAVEGAGQVPAYRGIAYVVIEDLDLSPYGNRLPQLSFEVFHPARPEYLDSPPQPSEAIRAVAMMPGTGEYALATTPISLAQGFGRSESANVNTAAGVADFAVSLEALEGELPNCGAVSLIVSWFGDDLRAGQCSVKPKVEQQEADGAEMPWTVAGLTRSSAELLAQVEGRAVYGGTPTDQSVIEAIEALNAAGQEVMFYPFLLMEILADSGKPDPWDVTGDQPALPWRGRITGEKAPGVAGSPDGTSAAEAEVSAFFGTASAADFSISPGSVSYSGPAEWSYRRFILHNAALCAAAGGVESFCIGSEMRSLTQLRGASGFPAVDALIALAAEVRALLPDAKLSYAADWSEYFGYHPQDGSGDVYFHLDPLWADANIDFIGIDNYMPLSDWRDGRDHADIGWRSIYELDYLRANIEGGEGYDWYYPSDEAREAQLRAPITDGAFGEDWVFRYKDLRGWWENLHVHRRRSFRFDAPDALNPQSWEVIGGSATPEAGVVEETFDHPMRIASAGATWHRLRRVVDLKAGQVYDVELVFTRGSSSRFRWFVYSQDGAYHYVQGTIGNLTFGNGVLDLEQTEIAPDIWRLRFSFVVAQDTPGARPSVGPFSATSGDDVILWGMAVLPRGLSATGWIPRSKPIRFTEMGCAAVDKGTNQPNKFLDPKSSESGLPHFSNGRRDDLIQMQYLRAMTSYWLDPARNPVSEAYAGPMLDMDHAYVWAWDARPWPAFPNALEVWSDGENHARGHWISGRMGAEPLADVVAAICEEAGITDYDVSELYGFVRGAMSSDVESGRARLQPLMLAYGFEAVERDGVLVFRSRTGLPDADVSEDWMAVDEDGASAPLRSRAPEADKVGRVRLTHVEAAGQFEARVAEAVFPDDGSDTISESELPLVLTGAEGRGITERWLAEARVARDTISFSLPPSRRDLGAGSVFALPDGSTWRIDRLEDAGARKVEAVRSEAEIYQPSDTVEESVSAEPFVPPLPVSPVFMDLPLLTGDEVEHAPHLAVAAEPWPGSVAVYSSPSDSGYTLNTLVDVVSAVGVLETPLFRATPGLWDRGPVMRVRMSTGSLSSTSMADVLNGANAAAVGDGSGANWEVIQFVNATLVGEDLWDISLRLRGQAGSDGIMPDDWPVGSLFVLLDGRPRQIELPLSARGLQRHYRVGPAGRSYDHPVYDHQALAFDGVGLRPYAPAHLRAPKVGTDRQISWIRRTRIDGDSWQGTEVPLGEDIEAYLLHIRDAGGLRREETLSVPAFTYTNAMQVSDSVTLPYTIEIAQISARFGPGPFTRIEIND
ncbi:baseplate multidomain protein megatron [Nioella sp.]|uniref:baseplate multidomain protein megatron n=1 Tax=Nioella sp. TaxID=1912091 RepID=UPI003B5247FE